MHRILISAPVIGSSSFCLLLGIVAAYVLARANARILTVVGAGAQAAFEIRALAQVRRRSEIRICARRPEAAAMSWEWAPGWRPISRVG